MSDSSREASEGYTAAGAKAIHAIRVERQLRQSINEGGEHTFGLVSALRKMDPDWVGIGSIPGMKSLVEAIDNGVDGIAVEAHPLLEAVSGLRNLPSATSG